MPWRDTTLRGDVRRGTGILNNEMYVGVRVWNHKHHVKDPRTGKAAAGSTPNPNGSGAQRRICGSSATIYRLRSSARSRCLPSAMRRSRRASTWPGSSGCMASAGPPICSRGLLESGACGGAYGIVVHDRYGCINHHRRHICANSRTIRRAELERRALAGIADRLVSAVKVKAAVAAYAAHINRDNRERRVQIEADRRALARIERAVAGIMAAVEDGLYQPAMKARMAELERQRAEITARMAQAPIDIPDVHPGIAEIYRHKVARLTDTLEDPDTRLDASSDIRSLIGRIVLHPGERRGEVRGTLRGSLMGILDFVNDNPRPDANRIITSVASGSLG